MMTKLLLAAFGVLLWTAAAGASMSCGDVNDDGAVDLGDALVIAQYDAGMQACGFGVFARPRACDVTGDGSCDMADANAVMECDAGIISCDFACEPFRCLRGQRKLGHRSGVRR